MDLSTPDNPFFSVLIFLGAGYLLYLWLKDKKAAEAGQILPGALPGAASAPSLLVIFGVAGALILVILETLGEYGLGIVEEQTTLRFWFLFAGLGAAVIEEVIFRGYLVVQNKGRAMLVGSILVFSLLFALLHPHLWAWDEDGFRLQFTVKAFYSTAFLFLTSLFFYTLRFHPANKNRSLLPCFVAHAVLNVAVFLIKATQGFIVWN